MPEHGSEPPFGSGFAIYDDDLDEWVAPTHVRRRSDGSLRFGCPGSEAEATGWRELDGYDRWVLLAADGVLREYANE